MSSFYFKGSQNTWRPMWGCKYFWRFHFIIHMTNTRMIDILNCLSIKKISLQCNFTPSNPSFLFRMSMTSEIDMARQWYPCILASNEIKRRYRKNISVYNRFMSLTWGGPWRSQSFDSVLKMQQQNEFWILQKCKWKEWKVIKNFHFNLRHDLF